MFEITNRVLQECNSNLEKQKTMLGNQIAELEEVIGVVAAMASLENYCGRLRSIKEDIHEENNDYGQINQALIRIAQSYAECENKIIDECEGNRFVYQLVKADVVRIPHRISLL